MATAHGSIKHAFCERQAPHARVCADIPREFKGDLLNPHVKFQSKWFFKGLDKMPAAKEGIDQIKAMRHLAAIQGSFEPKHEHKQAAVAYLASLWLQIDGNE